MARFRQFIHNVGASYAALGATVAYSLVSVPLALGYLSKEQFGLWALLAQVAGYLTLIDIGMTGAATRLLIDCKEDHNPATYAAMVKTSFLVAVVQGLLIVLIGFLCAPYCPALLGIRSDFGPIFIHLLLWQATITAVSFITRPLGQMLGAHQRLDIIFYSQFVQMSLGLGLFWLFLHRGYGLNSFVYCTAIGAGVDNLCLLSGCLRFGLFPRSGTGGHASWTVFKKVFAFGKDLFLVTVGTQLIMASQLIVLTRCLGLGAAAAWAVGTRVLNLLLQLIWRISDTAGVTLAEMIARGERDRLRRRYADIVTFSASLGATAALVFATSNTLFVEIWTSNKIAWSALNDVLLGLWLILLVLIHLHCGFVLLTKKVAMMRFVYFAEGCAFAIISLLVLRFGKLPAMIVTSIGCAVCFSGAYGMWRVADYFGLPLKAVAVDWLQPMFRVLLFGLPVAALAYFGFSYLPPLPRFVLTVALVGVWSSLLIGRLGLPSHLQREVLARTPRFAYPFLQRLFAIG
ncbi:MAG: lipopolysaccharide biosynthesis protein [Bryobacteraceae bacterium]